MPLFICDKCDVLENTAAGDFWTPFFNGKQGERLCSQCSTRKDLGKWHGIFEREIMTEEKIAELEKEYPDYFYYKGRFANKGVIYA